MDLEDARVDLHQTGHHERSRLPTSILRLERIVDRWIVDDMRDRVRLNNRWLEVVKLGETLLDVLRHLK